MYWVCGLLVVEMWDLDTGTQVYTVPRAWRCFSGLAGQPVRTVGMAVEVWYE